MREPGGEREVRGPGSLPARGRAAAHDHVRSAGAPGQALGERHEAFALTDRVVGVGAGLRRTNGRDLRAHQGAEAREPGEQRLVAGITTRVPVGDDDPVGDRGRAERLEVHDEEGEIERHVADPQRGIELEAVDDLRRVGQDDVLGPEIAVALAHEAARRAPRQRRGPAPQE